jgi:hypothetical protein
LSITTIGKMKRLVNARKLFVLMCVKAMDDDNYEAFLTQGLQTNIIICVSSVVIPPISSIPIVHPPAHVEIPVIKGDYRYLLDDVFQPDVVKELCKPLVIEIEEASQENVDSASDNCWNISSNSDNEITKLVDTLCVHNMTDELMITKANLTHRLSYVKCVDGMHQSPNRK